MKNIFEQFEDKIGVIVDWKQIDDLVTSDANILRPVKGHAFEVLFDEVVHTYLRCRINKGAGDSDIDRILYLSDNQQISLQLKTVSKATVKINQSFGVSLHKTHGIEKRPTNLYPMQVPCPICSHEEGIFPDFLIILHPESGILIVPKNQIPESKNYPLHFADPAIFQWASLFLNAWDLLGYPQFKGKSLERRTVEPQKKLPKTAAIVNLTDEEIVKMWLEPENFRTVEMNLKGNLREPALIQFIEKQGIIVSKPNIPYPKFDAIIQNGQKIQVKGCSKNLCDIKRKLIGVEVMGTHGKGAIRCYYETDFDYLGLVIDPIYIQQSLAINSKQYYFAFIPSNILPLHYKNDEWNEKNKLYPICKFHIQKDENGLFLTPFSEYKKSVSFRSSEKIYLNKLPQSFY